MDRRHKEGVAMLRFRLVLIAGAVVTWVVATADIWPAGR
jgi:hypothetical protein